VLDVALPLRVPQPAEVRQLRDLQQVQLQVQQLLRGQKCTAAVTEDTKPLPALLP